MNAIPERTFPARRKIFIQSGAGLCMILLIASCGRTWHEATHDYAGYSIQSTLPADSLLEAYLAPYRQELALTMDDTVAEVGHTLTLKRPESTLGNFMADLLADEAERITGEPVDLALQNYGGVRRNSLHAGPMRMGMIYEIMPFDNQLVVLELDARGLHTLIQHIAKLGGWPVSKGVRFQIQAGMAQAILVNNRPIQEGQTYRVALTDYIANGGDQCDFLTTYPVTDTGILVRDAIIHYCRARQEAGLPLDAVLDGRITQIP